MKIPYKVYLMKNQGKMAIFLESILLLTKNISLMDHPSLLIDFMLKGHLHRYKLHPIFQFFMGFHMVPLLKRRVWRFFRAGPNGPSPPTRFQQQNSTIPPPSIYKFCCIEGTFDWFPRPLLTVLNKQTHQFQEIVPQIFEYLQF